MCARIAIPCRIDRRVPSRDGNSAGGLGSLDFGLQRTLPDIDFPPPRPPLSFLRFGSQSLLSLSLSLALDIVVAFGFAVLFALIAPRSLLSFRFVRLFVPRSPLFWLSSSSSSSILFFSLRSECSPERRPIWRHRTKCVKAWRGLPHSALAHAHAHDHPILSAHVAFLTFRRVDARPALYFYIMESNSISEC